VSSNTFVNQHTFCIDCTLSLSCANDVNPMTLELKGVVAESAISVCLGKELKHIPTSTLWFGWLDCVVPIRVWAVFNILSQLQIYSDQRKVPERSRNQPRMATMTS